MCGKIIRIRVLFVVVVLAAAFTVAGPSDLDAQGDSVRDGSMVVPRLGVTLGHEQVTLGVEVVKSNLADITHLEFRPGVDLGLGDDRTTLRGSANVGYSVPTSGGDVRVTPLFGVSIGYESHEFEPGNGEPRRSESDTDVGVNLGAAAQAGDLVFEAVIVVGGRPDLAISVGFGVG